MQLKGKTVVITGASSGIGRASALEFARRGANLVIGGASVVDGAILAIYRNLDLSAGFVNGAVISKGNINIGSGEQVVCPCP